MWYYVSMKFIITIFLVVFSFQSKADAITRAALNYGQRALLSYPTVNKLKKNTEKYIFSFLPADKEKMAVIGGLGFAIYSGSISTRNFKNMNIGVLGWNVSPELSLNTKTGQMFALVSINKQF